MSARLEPIRFHFDPLCPWCYLTSKWVHRLVELGEVAADWGVFSLEINNTKKDSLEDAQEFRAFRALRTVVAVREDAGGLGVGAFYRALGSRTWDDSQDLRDPATIEASLRDAGLSANLHERAMSDPSTWDVVVAEHTALVRDTRSFGVPTIRLDGGTGPAIFGPVISQMPNDDDAVELWRHVSWLARYENFSELKRDRTLVPDLEGWRVLTAKRAAEKAQKEAAESTAP